MTVSSTNRKAGPYYGNGVTAAFPFSFKVFAASDLLVVKTNLTTGVDTVLAATDYSVSLTTDNTGGYSGGTVTLTAGALASTYTLTITSSILYTQNTDLTNTGGFYPKVINSALDRLTILCQQLLEQVSRSLKLSISTPTGVTPTLPAPVKNNIIAWNENADGLQNLNPQALATIVAFGTANSDKFSGDGSTTQFALSNNPGALNNLDVSIGGVTQRPGIDYTWSAGTVITFTTAPAAGTNNILVRYMQGLPQGYTTSDLVQYGQSNVKDALDAINLTDYAALRAYTGSARQVCITGYLVSAAPSQIAGDFVRDSSDTTSADNGATTIVSVDGTRWKRQASCSVQASWFGVRGDWDGVNGTDNWAALQAAILWAYQNSIGYVELGAGRHRISKPLYLYGSDNPTKAGVSLRGRGVRATTLERSGNSTTNDGSWYASVDSTLIMTPYPVPTSATPITGTYNVGVSDMSISGNAAGTNTYGVYTKDSFGQIKFERVCILNTVNSFRTDADMWMSSFENISMHPVSSGFWMNKSGTSIILKDAYVLGGGADSGVGFNLQALYSHAESVAVEGFTGTPFQFRFANFAVNGLGVECASATQPAVVVANSSSITVNNTLILCPNAFLVGSGCSLKVTNPQLGDEFAPTARAGYLWFVAGTGNLCIENLRAYDTYATANTGFALLSTAGTSGSGALGINKLEIKGNTSDNSQMAADVTNSSGVRLWGVRNDGVFWTGLAPASPYNNTSAGAANLGVDNNGILFRSTSSLKYKKNVKNAVHGLAEVMKLRPVTYSGKSEADGNKVFGGLIAEEVHDAGLTEFVVYADDGTPDALAYANMVSLLVKAMQELKVQVDSLSNKQV